MLHKWDKSRFWPEGTFPDALDPKWEAISAYVDGELDPDAAQAVAAWLAHDAEAQQVYDDFCRLQQQVNCIPVPAGQPDLAVQVLRRVRHEDRLKAAWRCLNLGIAVAIATAGWHLWPRSPEMALSVLETTPTLEVPSLETPLLEPSAPESISEAEAKSEAAQQAATYLLANKPEHDPLAILLQDL